MKHLKTEQPNPRSRGLDQKSSLAIVRLMNSEDARVSAAVRRELPKIARAVDAIVESLAKGGRLIYVGAGTSGRIAFLDAAECPPTFGTPPTLVRAVIAGGNRAMRKAVEGAEDSLRNGARDLQRSKLTSRDVVVGIAASGTTPYVLGALKYSRQVGAMTIGLTSNPKSPLARLAQITIAPNTGPEVLSGSTRMKAGTAQKMVLNMLSTAAMVRLGRAYENWMIRMKLTNEKLQKRAARILEQAAGVSASKARHALRQARHDLPVALVMLQTGSDSREAQQHLAKSNGNVRAALKHAAKQARER
ncbi:MAG TPA: N-acetylmuramic acid 6-phosphate etherase [Candidatus Acidoferrum sp.]|nr:N-acetylmuramic acid 6-phosphate etherase [Candidatus Acidoferrum sp.]